MPQKIKILLVEDEAITALQLKDDLERMGYDVHKPLATGEAAVKAVKGGRFDLVMMDIRLAGRMDGIEAAMEIASSDDVPIVFMTGYRDEDMQVRTRAIRSAAYLVKPVSLDDIQRIIDGLFSKK
ncbi:MAG TPA: response regulator [bacterium]|nr:response regulator [bacterium]